MFKNKIFVLFVALCTLLSSFSTCFAAGEASYDGKIKELNEVQRQIRDMKVQKDAARRRAQRESRKMNAVVRELGSINKRMNHIKRRQPIVAIEMANNRRNLKIQNEKLERRMKVFKKRLREIYIHGQINYLDVLLGATDFEDFSSRIFLLEKIISRDVAMIDSINKTIHKINVYQADLAQQEVELKELKVEYTEKQKEAENKRQERAQLLYKAEEERRSADAEYDRLLAISENITSMLNEMEKTGQMTGAPVKRMKFIWPVQGTFTSYYGWRIHPIFKTRRYHSGYDIACPTGTPIQACADGKVIYSGWMGGYGYTIMLDHGGGLVSLYGHNSGLAVKEGTKVYRGQVIAYAGSTGWSTGPHCHFEARLHGQLTDPKNYF